MKIFENSEVVDTLVSMKREICFWSLTEDFPSIPDGTMFGQCDLGNVSEYDDNTETWKVPREVEVKDCKHGSPVSWLRPGKFG